MKSMKQYLFTAALSVILLTGGVTVMASEFTIYVVRHAEKAVAESDPPLSELGQQRANALAQLLAKAELKAIYSTPYKRTQETVQPLAEQLALELQTYRPGAAEEMAKRVIEQRETSLIVGHSNTVPALVRALGGHSENLTEKDYGDLFQLTFFNCQPSEGTCELVQTRFMVPTPESTDSSLKPNY